MRIIIYTGKGGVGKTSVAAATGVRLAQEGYKTVVISTDLAHSLSDSFELALEHEPTPVIDNLWAQELNPQRELEESWDSIYNYMVKYLKTMGLKDVFAEELTLIPGMEELFSLLEIYDHYKSGKFDALILDCPPTASTLRLLSFFDLISWAMDKFFNIKRKSIGFLRKFTDTLMDIPLPEDDVFDAMERLYDKMSDTRELLIDPEMTSVRLVMNPEQMVINETQRAYTYLNLYALNVDGVIVNKVLSKDLKGDFIQNWIKRQQENIEIIESTFEALELFKIPYLNDELKGIKKLEQISKLLYNGKNPLDTFQQVNSVDLLKEDGHYIFKVYMPFLKDKKRKFDLHQKGMVLIITVGSYKRKLVLPQLLGNKQIVKASYKEDYLQIYFR
mgnify:FL=1